MSELVVAHTGQLDRTALASAYSLLQGAFPDGFDGHDWEHCLGGLHALIWHGTDLIGHAALVQRRLLHRGHALRTGYVEGVAVRADARGRGHAAALMSALEEVARGGYELAALSSSEQAAAFYAGRGWSRWQGRTSVLTPRGVARTPDDDDSVYVLPFTADLDLSGELTCDWRRGDVW